MIARTLRSGLKRLSGRYHSFKIPASTDGIARVRERLDRLAFKIQGSTDAIARVQERLDRLAEDVRFIKRRLTTYVGDGVALTWLADETPFFVNTGDVGSPMNLINGGLFEEDNLEVLLSYLKPHALCVDIGANLGLFSLKLAKRLRPPGKVMAFELHPMLCDLMKRNLVINGLEKMVTVHNYGLYDREGTATFNFPRDHLGAGHVGIGPELDHVAFPGQIRRLDDVLPPVTVVDLVKIDVERHEPQVLQGMRRVIRESPDIVILFEKLAPQSGDERQVENCLGEAGLKLFGILPDASLEPLTSALFAAWSGYVLALRPDTVGPLRRSRFSIYPAQFWSATTRSPMSPDCERIVCAAPQNNLLFYGPYWPLRSGRWRLRYFGQITGRLNLSITERYGHHVAELSLDGETTDGLFVAEHDLINFECVGHAGSRETRIDLQRLEFERIV